MNKLKSARDLEIAIALKVANDLLQEITKTLDYKYKTLLHKETITGPHAGFMIYDSNQLLGRECVTATKPHSFEETKPLAHNIILHSISLDFDIDSNILSALFLTSITQEISTNSTDHFNTINIDMANPHFMNVCINFIQEQLQFKN